MSRLQWAELKRARRRVLRSEEWTNVLHWQASYRWMIQLFVKENPNAPFECAPTSE